jgi:hypothetical protein
MRYQDALARVIEEVIEPGAAEVDASAVFPRRQIGALAEAGLLALTVPADFGGGGEGMRAASHVVRELGAVCGSTAMIVTMHYSATAALTAAGMKDTLTAIAAGRHLSTLAFSESGSRSHFWAPLSTAAADGDDVRLDARKSWVTAAGEANSYVWSSRPLVAQGAIEHSTYRTDPYGRLERTVMWVTVVCFGTTSEAERVSGRVTRLHRRVSGVLPEANGTSRVPGGTTYSADDPDLLRWVHASFVDTMLVAHDALIGGLDERDRDAFVREWDAVALLMGLPRRRSWKNAAALRRYVQQEVERGGALPGAGSLEVAETVLHPPVGSPWLRPGKEIGRAHV